MTALVVLEGLVILLLLVLVAGVLRSHAEILKRLDALGAGENPEAHIRVSPRRSMSRQAPSASLNGTTPGGGAVSVALRGSRGYTLLAFLSTGCSSCGPLWRGLADGVGRPDVRLVVVTKGPGEESPAGVADLVPEGATTVMSSQAWESFRVPGTPYFLLVDAADGAVLGEGSAGSWPRVHDLLTRALGDVGHSDGMLGRSTAKRLEDADEALAMAGIAPGDQILFQKP